MFTISDLKTLSDNDLNRQLIDIYLREKRHMADSFIRTKLREECISRYAFFIPNEEFLLKIYGEPMARKFLPYHKQGIFTLNSTFTIPLLDVADQFHGFLKNNPNSVSKYVYPTKDDFNKSRLLNITKEDLRKIMNEGRVALCEGYFDQMAIAMTKTITPILMGGSDVSPELKVFLRGIRNKYIFGDMDSAGSKVKIKMLNYYKSSGVSVVAMPKEIDDIDEYLRTKEHFDYFKNTFKNVEKSCLNLTVLK